MILVMHWAVKEMRIKKLMQSKNISISVDDRKEYRLVRYRCSMPVAEPAQQDPEPVEQTDRSKVQGPMSLQEWASHDVLASEGVLGVFKVGVDDSLESHDMDKSESMAKSIWEILKRMCQDPEGQCNSEALDHVAQSIRHFASDQGPNIAKVGKLLMSGGKFPNLVYLSFDAAHQIRIASKDPLHALPAFNQQFHRLFSGPNALLPAIQHSKAWQSKLLTCQQMVLKKHGVQGGIDKALKSLSYAPHRFDSAATPLFKFCALIRAIAFLCGMQAADAP